MAKLTYAALMSLDGFIEDEEGKFDWAVHPGRCRRPAPASSARLDPEAIRRLKAPAERDISVSGPHLAAHAFRAGLVDGVHLFVFPVAVGGGKPALPRSLRLGLTLAATHTFPNGTVHLHHSIP